MHTLPYTHTRYTSAVTLSRTFKRTCRQASKTKDALQRAHIALTVHGEHHLYWAIFQPGASGFNSCVAPAIRQPREELDGGVYIILTGGRVLSKVQRWNLITYRDILMRFLLHRYGQAGILQAQMLSIVQQSKAFLCLFLRARSPKSLTRAGV